MANTVYTPIETAADFYQSLGWPTVYIGEIEIDSRGKKTFKDVEPWESATADMPIRRGKSVQATAIGVRTGEISGVMFVDVDGECPAWDALLAQSGGLETWQVQTRSFGAHYGFQWDPRMERFAKNDVGLAAHIVDGVKMGAVDIRANGRIVVAPPSECSDGTGYTIVDREAQVEPMPDWLFDALSRWQDEKAAAKKAAQSTVAAAVEVNINEDDARLKNALGDLMAAVDGEKHSVLNRSCFIIGGLCAGGVLSKERAVELVTEACKANGRYPFDPAQKTTMLGALAAGFKEPLSGSSVEEDLNDILGFNNPSIALVTATADDATPASDAKKPLHLDSPRPDDVALQLMRTPGHWLPIYKAGRDTYWLYNDRATAPTWRRVKADAVTGAIRVALIGSTVTETTEDASGNKKSEVVRYKNNPSSAKAVSQVVCELAAEDGFTPGKGLVFSNGYSLVGGQIVPTSPDHRLINSTEYGYDPMAECPTWDRWLLALVGGDTETRDLLEEFCFYVLSGDTSRQKGLMLSGLPGVGKGTFIRTLKRQAGLGNSASLLPQDMANEKRFSGWMDKTLGLVPDLRLEPGSPAAADLLVTLLNVIGEDGVTVDNKYGEKANDVTLGARIVIGANERPTFKDASGAAARRLLVVPVVKQDYIPDLEPLLFSELPGILNRLLVAGQRLEARGFTESEVVQAATQDFADGSSPLASFVRDFCVVGPDEKVTLSEFRGAFNGVQEDDSTHIRRPHFAGEMLRAMGYVVDSKGFGQRKTGVHGLGLDYAKLGEFNAAEFFGLSS